MATDIEIITCVDPITESNCYLLSCEGHAVVIDPNDKDRPLRKLKELGLVPELILLSHEHCDHMIGADPIRAAYPDCKMICSNTCNEGLQSERLNMTAVMQVYLSFRGKPAIPYPRFKCNISDISFSGEYNFEWRGHRFRIKELPGHTPGSECIILDENILFSGDYLIPEEEVILRMPGGNEDDYKKFTVPFLDQLNPELFVYPGHKYPFKLSNYKAYGD